jgi:drug/metabolite transporter (DMT)-like permease
MWMSISKRCRIAASTLNLASLGLLTYVLFSVLRTTNLKALQMYGAHHPINAEKPISFCNVFLISQLMVGLALVLSHGRQTLDDLPRLDRRGRWLIASDAFLGCFLAPMSFFLALDKLSVINQTLLFSLTLPCTAAVACWWLKEHLPDRFWWSLVLVISGVLIGKLLGPMVMASGPMPDQSQGVLWASVSILATALRSSLRRILAVYPIGRGLSAGIPNLAGALVFALIALRQYGPQHFFYLSLWWVLGVIVLYGLSACLGTELLRQFSQRHFTVTQVGLASSATLVVTVLSAALVLGETIRPATLISMVLILAGVTLPLLVPSRREGAAAP